jgi:hypothetical protein
MQVDVIAVPGNLQRKDWIEVPGVIALEIIKMIILCTRFNRGPYLGGEAALFYFLEAR